MKSTKEILTDFMNFLNIGEYRYAKCLLKLRDGEDCLGEIELIHNNVLQFYPDWDEALKNYDYERYEEDECLQYVLIPFEDIDIDHLYYWNEKSSCFINARWSVDSKSWVHNETSPGSIPLDNYFSNPTKDNRCLKKVGYWQSDEGAGQYYPHPKYLVEPGWKENERSKIVAYLKSGHECGHWCGFSYCRFGCFSQPPDRNTNKLAYSKWKDGVLSMGCLDLTDGEWVWPQGLAHYVENHNVCLPNQFIQTMEENSWLIPSEIDFQHRSEVGVSSLYWVNWAINYFKSKST